jgi:hypothetical protein
MCVLNAHTVLFGKAGGKRALGAEIMILKFFLQEECKKVCKI